MARFILDVNELAGVTTVLIEHDMGVVMDISDRVSVLDFGRVHRRRHARPRCPATPGRPGLPRRGQRPRRVAARVSARHDVPRAAAPARRRTATAGIAAAEKRYGIWQPIDLGAVRASGPPTSPTAWQRSASSAARRSPSSATTGPEWLIAELAAQSLGGALARAASRQRRRGGRRTSSHCGQVALRRGRGPGAGRQARRAQGTRLTPSRRARHLLRPARARELRAAVSARVHRGRAPRHRACEPSWWDEQVTPGGPPTSRSSARPSGTTGKPKLAHAHAREPAVAGGEPHGRRPDRPARTTVPELPAAGLDRRADDRGRLRAAGRVHPQLPGGAGDAAVRPARDRPARDVLPRRGSGRACSAEVQVRVGEAGLAQAQGLRLGDRRRRATP